MIRPLSPHGMNPGGGMGSNGLMNSTASNQSISGHREQLLALREKLLERYKHVFNDIFDLEWRMAWVTPWYMQQAGKIGDESTQDTGTIDFEAYMPYRGDQEGFGVAGVPKSQHSW